MTKQYTPQRMARLIVVAALAIGSEAAAAPSFLDGSPVQNQTTTACLNGPTTGAVSHVGFVVDPVAQLPKLGQVTYIHAVVKNNSPCAEPVVGFEFFLPVGASFAVSTAAPVKCFIGNGVMGGTNGGPGSSCLQVPEIGNFGGRVFGTQTALAQGWAFEIQVPVIYDQQLIGAAGGPTHLLSVLTTSQWGALNPTIPVTAPFVPPQPTPNPFAIGDDIALLGGSSPAGTLPVAFSNDDGSFTVTNGPVGEFAAWAATPNVQRLSGDFNGDGVMDFALVGGPNWNTIPVAMSLGNGQFTVTNSFVGDFGGWAGWAGVKALTGDFNHDGHTDIALVGGAGWTTLPVAFNTGNGNFNVTNLYVGGFAGWASAPGARALTGDFNKDGFTDIALTGGLGWTTLPVAFSYGNGSFNVTNQVVPLVGSFWGFAGHDFARYSAEPGVQAHVGDFNKDGFTDIALTGGAGWTSIPIAFSRGNGTFLVTVQPAGDFNAWSSSPGVKVLSGDFNKDGYTDLALTGGAGWFTIPVAFSAGGGSFNVTNNSVTAFGGWASTPGARAIAGDFNGDGYTDIALTGVAGWTSIPVAFNAGNGSFTIANKPASNFPGWSSLASASLVVGRIN